MKKICVIGTGYVGLVTGACLAEFGHNVVCIDVDEEKIEGLKNGVLPIFEPGLEDLVGRNYAAKRLGFSTQIENVRDAEVVFIAVGTPESENGSADMKYVYAVAKDIANNLGDHYTVIVNKSTVPVGTGEKVKSIIREANPAADFDVVSNPEFLREGEAVRDSMLPDRVVIGTDSTRAADKMKAIFNVLYVSGVNFKFIGVKAAELAKYGANAFLAVRVSFFNEIANICELVGADAKEVIDAITSDNRIGNRFARPGPGYGGSCFPKDTKALLQIAMSVGMTMRLVEAAVCVNETQRKLAVKKIQGMLSDSVKGKTIAILGLTFKPDTDDVRESPAQYIIRDLLVEGANIRSYDPNGIKNFQQSIGVITDKLGYFEDAYEACKGADAIVLMTEYREFRALDLEAIKRKMKSDSAFIDLRNVYDPKVVKSAGFRYSGIGRM